jgi:hypothetical protein
MPIFFDELLGENILKITTSVPGQSLVTYFLLAVIYSCLWCCRRCRQNRSGSGFDAEFKSASIGEVMKRRGIR